MQVFAETFVPAGVGDWWFGAQPCPACDASSLHPVASLEPARWLCASCGRCWTAVHGHLQAVDPWTCGGCATRNRHACIALAQCDATRAHPELLGPARADTSP